VSASTTEPPVFALADIPPEGLGRPIKGPSALGSDRRRLWPLTWTLAKTEFKLAFFGSALGYLWQIMRPLLLFGVIYLVLSKSGLGSASKQPFFPAALLLGIVLFSFFSESTGGAVSCLVNRENLVRKIEFPRLAVPLSIVVTSLMNLMLNLIPVLIFLFAAGATPHVSWVEMPLLLIMLALLSTGLGMILSVSYVRYRDVQPIWDVILQITFYASGVFFSIATLKPVTLLGHHINLSHVLMANPFAALLQQSRHVFIDHRYPTAAHAIGGSTLLLIPIGIGVLALIGGFLLFDREAPWVAEQL
jgi:ABC-2 type transport system permease protein